MISIHPSPLALDNRVDVNLDLHPWHGEAVDDDGCIARPNLTEMSRNNRFDLRQKFALGHINGDLANIVRLRPASSSSWATFDIACSACAEASPLPMNSPSNVKPVWPRK